MRTQRISAIFLAFFIAALNISCNSKTGKRKAGQAKETTAIPKDYFTVTKVVDGDTFWIDDGTEKGLKIRLIGIDAPESRNAFKKKKEYFGKESKAYLTNLLNGKNVRLEFDVNQTDQYGRTLAYTYLENGTFINAELVKNGYATVMTVPPNVKYAEVFLKLQREARENNRGLWNEP